MGIYIVYWNSYAVFNDYGIRTLNDYGGVALFPTG